MDPVPEGSSPPPSIASLTARILADDVRPASRRRRPPGPNDTGVTVVASSHRKRSSAARFISPGWFPSGEAHAVPHGWVTALCGYVPPYIWKGPFQPELRGLPVCPSCARIFRTA